MGAIGVVGLAVTIVAWYLPDPLGLTLTAAPAREDVDAFFARFTDRWTERDFRTLEQFYVPLDACEGCAADLAFLKANVGSLRHAEEDDEYKSSVRVKLVFQPNLDESRRYEAWYYVAKTRSWVPWSTTLRIIQVEGR
jgi:hypothetical protein